MGKKEARPYDPVVPQRLPTAPTHRVAMHAPLVRQRRFTFLYMMVIYTNDGFP